MSIPQPSEEQRLEMEAARERLKKEVEQVKERVNSGQKAPVLTDEERKANRNASENIISVSDCLKPAVDGLKAMADKSNAFAKALRKEIMGIEVAQCPEHRVPLDINWDKTFADSWKSRETVVSYLPCPECKRMIDNLLGNERIKKMGIPAKLEHATIENFIADTPDKEYALRKLKHALDTKATFILFRGTYGTGKSHLASAVLSCRGGLFVTMQDLIAELRQTYSDNSGQESMVNKYRNAKVLVLDEITSEVKGVDIPTLLYRILGYRHDKGLLTMLTSNEQFKDILAILGGKITDRLRESYSVVTMEWQSNRKRS